MTLTIDQFLYSVLILIGIVISLVILYFLGFAIFCSYCSLDGVTNKFTVEKLIDMRISSAMTQHNSNYHSNSSNALKSKNKIKSTKGGRK